MVWTAMFYSPKNRFHQTSQFAIGVGVGTGVLNIRGGDPGSPISHIALPGPALDVDVDYGNDHVYVACGTAGDACPNSSTTAW